MSIEDEFGKLRDARVLHDVNATSPLKPDVEGAGGNSSASEPIFAVSWRGMHRLGVFADLHKNLEEQNERAASIVQDWLVEILAAEGLSSVWPGCPDHPGAHPLSSGVVGGKAVWVCPKSGGVIAEIGSLG